MGKYPIKNEQDANNKDIKKIRRILDDGLSELKKEFHYKTGSPVSVTDLKLATLLSRFEKLVDSAVPLENRNYYFTFGSHPDFPFQNTYLIVQAPDIDKAIAEFRKHYPDRKDGSVNCAFWYTQKQWDKGAGSYYTKKPAAILQYQNKTQKNFQINPIEEEWERD